MTTAIANHLRFGMNEDEAIAAWKSVSDAVSQWKDVFSACGVSGGDIDYLKGFIDADDKMAMRGDATKNSFVRSR